MEELELKEQHQKLKDMAQQFELFCMQNKCSFVLGMCDLEGYSYTNMGGVTPTCVGLAELIRVKGLEM